MMRGLMMRVRGLSIGMTAVLLSGCGITPGGGGSIPNSVSVTLPDGTSTTATLGAGVASLANSSWEFYITGELSAAAGQSVPFVVINFGPKGELTRFDSSTIAPEIFGDTIHFDGKRHSTNQTGVSYSAGTYGAEAADASGFTFEGRIAAFVAGINAANATVTASGAFSADDPDEMSGEFAFSVRVTVASIPQGNVDQAYSFVAFRVTE